MKQNLKCDFSDIPDAFSAFNRAQTLECKNEIENLACNSKLDQTLSNIVKTKSKCTKSIRKHLVNLKNFR